MIFINQSFRKTNKTLNIQLFVKNYSCRVLHFYFAADVGTVDLASFDSAVIASTMKKYLRELPDPVIPEQFYTKFVDAASKIDFSFEQMHCWLSFLSAHNLIVVAEFICLLHVVIIIII